MEGFSAVLKDIRKAYGSHVVLERINLAIDSDSYYAILGKSGAGKSTLMNILGLLESADSGEYIFNGKRLHAGCDYSALRRRQIGFIFQSYNLIEGLTVMENILLPLQYGGSNVEIGSLIDRLGLSQLTERSVNTLSGGEKQRAAIARALVLDPALLIADEPTGNLDEENRKRVFEILREEHKNGRAIVMITHDREAAGEAERRFFIQKGELHEE